MTSTPTTTSTLPKTLDLRGLPEDERNAQVNRALCAMQGWTQLPDPTEPACPECGASIGRPKCMFELGGDCPRHEVAWKWKQRLKRKTWKVTLADDVDLEEVLTPFYATSMEAILPLLPPRFDCFANPAYGFKIIIDNGPDFPSWSESTAPTLPLAACYVLLSQAGYAILL